MKTHVYMLKSLSSILLVLFLFAFNISSQSSVQAECVSGDCYVGTLTWPDGQRYEGEIKDGKGNGKGILTLPDGHKFSGDFFDGTINGIGTYTFTDGQRYEGSFRGGKRHGIGTYTWPSGEKYEGEWMDGKRHGIGTFTWSDGKKYVGEWLDDKPVEQANYKPYFIIFGIIFIVVIVGMILRGIDKYGKQKQTSSTQNNQNTNASSKTEWKEDKLKGPNVSTLFICPHCEESIAADVVVCPFCAEDVKNTALASPISGAISADGTASEEKVAIGTPAQGKPPASGELSSIKIRMIKLEALLAEGVITQDEFNSKKEQLINAHLDS